MKRTYLPILVLLAFSPSLAYGYGEGADIPEGSRIIHLLTNEARCNTVEALAECGTNCSEGITGCHQEVLAPLYWHDGLYRAAQFHAVMLNSMDANEKQPCMQHDSPCVLKDDVATTFPNQCDGTPACACDGGTATCGDSGTASYQRVQKFAGSYSAENLAATPAGDSSAYEAFIMWLYENGNGAGCAWSGSNGHRFNILGSFKNIGVGFTSARQGKWYGIASQDFNAAAPAEKPALTSGAGYKDKTSLWFKTHYYSSTAAAKVTVSIAGVKTELSKTRGTETNGTYGSNAIAEPATCAEYYFEATDTSGTVTRFPTTGVLLYHCDKSWKNTNDSSEPGGNEPGGNEPGGNEPGGNEPGGNQPGGNDPGSSNPDSSDSGTSDESGTDSDKNGGSDSDCSAVIGSRTRSSATVFLGILAGMLVWFRRRRRV